VTTQKNVAQVLGISPADTDKVAPLLEDAASVLAEESVPSESEIQALVAGTYKFDAEGSHSSDDTERRLTEAEQNVSRWRTRAQVFLNGAAVLLKRASPSTSRYEAKKRVIAALRAFHPSRGSELFYFTRETGVEMAPEPGGARAELAPPQIRGKSFHEDPAFAQLVRTPPDRLTAGQIDVLLRLLSIVIDPRIKDESGQSPAVRVVELLARAGSDRVGACVLQVLARPEAAKSVDGEPGQLAIWIRRLVVRLPATWTEKIVRAVLEAGWSEWIDRPLLDAPLDTVLREKLLREYGSRQEPRGNPYRPAEEWFYSLEEE
jgi:hypothetical protein